MGLMLVSIANVALAKTNQQLGRGIINCICFFAESFKLEVYGFFG
jgi:hypothetical protein